MRIRLIAVIVLAACGGKSTEELGKEAAKAEEMADLAKQKKEGKVAEKKLPPVPNMAHISCEQLINIEAFQTGLAEKEPITLKDMTKNEAEATTSCQLIRGGKKLTAKEQDAITKKEVRLGVRAGDPICQITAYCWTLEDADHFRKKCEEDLKKNKHDDSTGTYMCYQTFETGIYDVNVYSFFDDDTKCVLKASSGGPQADNAVIQNCAKIANTTIGPDQIKVTAATP